MPEPTRRIAWPPGRIRRSRVARHARVARDQRSRRLRVGHRGRRDHAPLSRVADRRAAGAARTYRDAEPRRRAAAVRRRPVRARSADASDPATPRTRAAPAISTSSGSRPACRCGATTSTDWSSRSGSFCRTCRTPCICSYELLSGADRVELALRPSVNFRAQEAPVSEPLGWPYEFRAVGGHFEICLARQPAAAAAHQVSAADASFTLKSERIDNVLYPVEESRGYQARGDLWSPGYLPPDAARRSAARRFVASTEPIETMSVMQPRDALDAERGRRRRLLALAGAGRARGRRRRAGARRRSVHHRAGRPHRGIGARARVRRRGANGDRRLSLVHRLGPRHDDQPRGADARDRPLRRGGLHPANLRALRARRPDPEHVPGRRAGRLVSHRRRHAVVLPRHRSVRRDVGRSR